MNISFTKLFLLVIFSSLVFAEQLNLSNSIQATLKLNTIHDGYYSEYAGYVWIYDNKYLVILTCKNHQTESVNRQFINHAFFQLNDSSYIIPFYALNSEVNLNDTPDNFEILFSVKREIATGLAVSLSIEKNTNKDNNDLQETWVDPLIELAESFGTLLPPTTSEITQLRSDITSISQASPCGNISDL